MNVSYRSDVSDNSDPQVLKDVIGLDQLAKLGFLGKVNVGTDNRHLEVCPETSYSAWTIVPLVIADRGKVVSEFIHDLGSDISLVVRVEECSLQ